MNPTYFITRLVVLWIGRYSRLQFSHEWAGGGLCTHSRVNFVHVFLTPNSTASCTLLEIHSSRSLCITDCSFCRWGIRPSTLAESLSLNVCQPTAGPHPVLDKTRELHGTGLYRDEKALIIKQNPKPSKLIVCGLLRVLCPSYKETAKNHVSAWVPLFCLSVRGEGNQSGSLF